MADTKKQITIEEAITACRKMFNISDTSLSRETDGNFLIDKREYTRDEVLRKLMDYFNDKVLIDGQCAIEAITLLYTPFHIEHRENNKTQS